LLSTAYSENKGSSYLCGMELMKKMGNAEAKRPVSERIGKVRAGKIT